MESRAGTVQSDECPLLCALRVAGHGTGWAWTGVDISCDKSRRLTGQHSMSSAAHTAPARILCSYCAATVQLPSEGLFLCSCRRRGYSCAAAVGGAIPTSAWALSVVLGSWGSRSGSRKGRGLGERCDRGSGAHATCSCSIPWFTRRGWGA